MAYDMLVKLYNVQDDPQLMNRLEAEGIFMRRAMAGELTLITGWVREKFSQGWADECAAAILRGVCWLAVKDKQIVGFACCEATAKGFFGPTGVSEELRGKGIGKALLIRSMISLKEAGYAYAVIGWVGPAEFYRKSVGATPIEDSWPGIYQNMVRI